MAPKLAVEDIEELLAEEFPQVGDHYTVLEVDEQGARVSLEAGDDQLRPGGTVSGPTIFELADLAFYVATLAQIGPEALAVTTNASINYMRKPSPGRLVAEARILKCGRSLCVGDVLVYSEGVEGPVAQASMTYSIPPG